MIAVTAVPSKAPSVLGISKSLKKSESASATRSMLPFCVETMATGPVKGVMPPPVDRCMVTPKINEAGVLVPLKYVSVPNGKTWPETTSLREWPVKVRALGGVPPLSSPQVTLDVPMPETTAVLVLSLETGRRVPVWRKSPDSTGLSKKPVMVPESLGAGAPGVEAMTIEEASVQAMPTIMIRRGCFIRSPFIVRMTEMFSSAARRGQWHSAARRNEDQSQRDLPVIARSLGGLGATQRPVDARGTERGVHSVWLRRRCWLCELPWLAPRRARLAMHPYLRNKRRARCYCTCDRLDPPQDEGPHEDLTRFAVGMHKP